MLYYTILYYIILYIHYFFNVLQYVILLWYLHILYQHKRFNMVRCHIVHSRRGTNLFQHWNGAERGTKMRPSNPLSPTHPQNGDESVLLWSSLTMCSYVRVSKCAVLDLWFSPLVHPWPGPWCRGHPSCVVPSSLGTLPLVLFGTPSRDFSDVKKSVFSKLKKNDIHRII